MSKKKLSTRDENELKLSIQKDADSVFFLLLLNPNVDLQSLVDSSDDVNSSLKILDEFIIRVKHKKAVLKIINEVEQKEAGLVSLDTVVLNNHKTVLRRAKLFKKFLKERSTPSASNKKLSLPEIAIIHAYKGIDITKENAQKNAEAHGWSSRTSGEKLYQHFNFYRHVQNRKGTEETLKKSSNKLNLLKKILSELEAFPDAKSKAVDEIATLDSAIKKQME